eukprot:Lankesteria_metandrocarpae@DN3113_c0_g1_i1.p1
MAKSLLICAAEADDGLKTLPFARGLSPIVTSIEQLLQRATGPVPVPFAAVYLVLFGEFKNTLTTELFSAINHHLMPLGELVLYLGSDSVDKDALFNLFEKCSLYSGFANPQFKQSQGVVTQLQACKPEWTSVESSLAPIPTAPKMNGNFIDEDALLQGVETYVPMAKGKSDCTSKPRACDNCSCGRKELEVELGAEEAKKRLEQGTVRSSCGNCYKGDAFRCAGCPYVGKPAFRPGTKLELDMDKSNTAPVTLQMSNEEVSTVVSGGKVQIQL